MFDETIEAPAPAITSKIAEYSVTAAALGQLRAKYERVLFAVTTTAGMKDAIAARAELRGLRIGLESMRKEIKAPALERTRLIDAEAKQITAELVALEDPIHAQIKAEECRKEAEKAERDRIEAERKAGITKMIDAIRAIPMGMAGEASAEINIEIVNLREFEPGESFAEFAADATAAAHTVIITLIGMRDKQAEIEAAAAKAEAERIAAAEVALAAEIESKRIADAQAVEAKRLADLAEKIEEAAKAMAIQHAADRAAFDAEKKAFDDKQAKIASDAEAVRKQAEIDAAHEEAIADNEEIDLADTHRKYMGEVHAEALAENEQWNFDRAVDVAEFEKIHAEALAMNEDHDAETERLFAAIPEIEVETVLVLEVTPEAVKGWPPLTSEETIADLIFTMRCLIHNINGGSFETTAQAVDAAYASIARAEGKAA